MGQQAEFFRAIAGDCLDEFTDLRLLVIAGRDGSLAFHHCSSIDDAVSSSEKLANTHDVYTSLGLMPRKLDPTSRGLESDVGVLLGMVVDVDVNHPSRGKTGYFNSIPEAVNALLDLPIRPSMLVNSGFGVHAYWLWKEPWILDEDERALAKSISRGWNHTVAKLLGKTIDSTFALNHIYRVPGTVNHKYEEKPATEILFSSDHRCDPSEFEAFAESAPALSLSIHPISPENDLSEKVRNLIAFSPDFAEQWHHTARTSSDKSQSGWDWRLAQIMVQADLEDQEIANALVANRAHWKGKRKPARYYAVTLAKIRASPANTPPPREETPKDEDDPEEAWYSLLSRAAGVRVDRVERSEVRGSIEDCTYWVNFRSGRRVMVRKDSQIRSYKFWTGTLRGLSPGDQTVIPQLVRGEWESVIEKLWAFAKVAEGSHITFTENMAGILMSYLDQNEVVVDDLGALRKNDRRPLKHESKRYFLKTEFLQWHQKNHGKIDGSVLEETLRIIHSEGIRLGRMRLRYIVVEESDLRREALGGEETDGGSSGRGGRGDQGSQPDGVEDLDPEVGTGEDPVLYSDQPN